MSTNRIVNDTAWALTIRIVQQFADGGCDEAARTELFRRLLTVVTAGLDELMEHQRRENQRVYGAREPRAN